MIHIENPKCPAEIYGILKRIKAVKIEFTPDVMVELLRCTNHPTSIRDLLKEIPEGKEAEFKEAILEMADRREHTNKNLETMRDIAKRGGFEAEFEEVNAKSKGIRPSFSVRVFEAKSQDDLNNNKDLSGYDALKCDFLRDVYIASDNLPKVCDFSNNDAVFIKGYDINKNYSTLDLSKHVLVFNKDVKLKLENVKMPKDFDFSQCKSVEVIGQALFDYNLNHENLEVLGEISSFHLAGISNGDENKVNVLDFSRCKSVGLNIDIWPFIKGKIKIIGGKNVDISLSESRNNKMELDFSATDNLHINIACTGQYNIRFKKGGMVSYTGRIADDMDFSMLDKLELRDCFISKKTKLPKKIRFSDQKMMRNNLDLSNIDEVEFYNCFPAYTTKFKLMGKVIIKNTKVAEPINLSECGEVVMEGVSFSKDNVLMLRDIKQKVDLCRLSDSITNDNLKDVIINYTSKWNKDNLFGKIITSIRKR